jgi:RNA polymerase sigma-70 factor (ECF subfamily)
MKGESEPDQCDEHAERETLRRALRGVPAAFDAVVVLYGRRLFAVAYAVVQDRAEAEDVVQETFLKAYARRWMIRDPDKLPAWLYRTARNYAHDLVRKHRPQFLPHDEPALQQVADDTAPCPSAGLRATERQGAVHGLLSALPDNYRLAVTLRFMEGMDYGEIATTMGLSRGALRGILARAMKSLRKSVGAALLTTFSD